MVVDAAFFRIHFRYQPLHMGTAMVTVADSETMPRFLGNGGQTGAQLRAMDWRLHPLGSPRDWPTGLQTVVGLLLKSSQPMFVVWGPGLTTIYNDAYAEICGNRHPAAQAAAFHDIWYDIWDDIGPMVLQVLSGQSIHMDDITLMMHRGGKIEETHFSFSYSPLDDDHGQVAGIFCACAETTQQVSLRRELDHERAMLGQIFEQAPSFIAKLDGPDHTFVMVNPAYVQLVGHRDIVGKPVKVALPEVVSQGYIDLLDSVLHTGQAMRLDGAKVALQRLPDGPMEERFVDFVYQPVRDAAGVVTGIFAEGVDVTDRRRALEALEQSEQFLRSVLAASPDCIKVLDLDGRLEFMSDGGRVVMEIPLGQEVEGCGWPDLWQDMEKGEVNRAIDLSRNGASSGFQAYSDTFTGDRRYWDVRITPMLDTSGQPQRILAVSRDISYLKRVEEEREHLMHELSHRLKNAFSMVQSVIAQTLRNANSVEVARDILSARVRALSGAQDILTRSIAGEMQLREVVDAALIPHRTGEGRFTITGPDVTINGRQGLGVSLALHELATNAAKYGALSGTEGFVSISWDIPKTGQFVFDWQESGGPPVAKPSRKGFGSVLIEKIVATYFEGSATLEYHPEGVHFRLHGKILHQDKHETVNPY
jgi:PAS domain S-box-containing protein